MSGYKFRNTNQGPPYARKHRSEGIIFPAFAENGLCVKRWICEHRFPLIPKLVSFRTIVKGTELTHWWDNGADQIAFCRGLRGFVAIAKKGNLSTNLQTCLNQGDYCDIVSGEPNGMYCTGKVVTVDLHGMAYIEILESDEDLALVIHKNVRSVAIKRFS